MSLAGSSFPRTLQKQALKATAEYMINFDLALKGVPPVKGLQNFTGRKIELIKDDPVAAPHSCQQCTLSEHKSACLICCVASNVFLQHAISY